MALSKHKIGDLVSVVDEKNADGIRDFYGININKEFMPTVANTEGINEYKYKVVRKSRFVYSGMQTGRDECIRISMYSGDEPIIVSPAYTTFEVTAEDKVLPPYFFMLFLSKEKDRLGWFYSDSSIRSNLDWDVFCDIELQLPPLEVQQKYVDIYNAMLENQRCYERGLDDLKLVCDAYIERLKVTAKVRTLGNLLSRKNERNTNQQIRKVVGLSTTKQFREAQSRVDRENLSGYKIVEPFDFVFVPTTDTWKVLAITFNNFGEKVVVSPIYEVFSVKNEEVLPEYLSLWFNRKEFDRYARFHSWGSARENFSFDDMCDVRIPLPDISVQRSIANIYKVYTQRKQINERLKAQIKDICPILIKGSLDEAGA